ncbi:MAG: hypothetical protein V4683_04405 [Bacteroidota bacterium]
MVKFIGRNNISKILKITILVLLCFSFFSTTAQNYTPTQQEFGQNRIQKREFNWKVLTSSNFELYYYGDAQTIANNSLQYAESEFERLSGLLGYSPYARTKIFFYNSPGEMFQSNANLNLTGEINPIETNLSKSKIEVAYTGEATSFKKVLINKVAEIFVYEMLYGGSLKDALQSSILLTLPDWFISGVSAYAADGWSNEMDDYMRDAILKKRVKKPEKLSGNEARLFGQSIWNFVAERYGKDNISNILNLTRIIRNEQTSIGSTLGTSYNRFLKEWRDFYANLATPLAGNYASLRTDFRIFDEKNDGNGKIISAKLSPDQTMIAFVMSDNGQFTIENFAIKSKKRTKIMKIGLRSLSKNSVSSLPLIAWAKGNSLAVVYENEATNKLIVYSEMTADKPKGKITVRKVIKGFQQITDIDFSEAGNALVLSADKKGQNDLFLYDISRGSTTQITNDVYDDRQPNFVGNSRTSIVYSSNRSIDSVKLEKANFKSLSNNFGIYFHDGNPRTELIRKLVDSVGIIQRPIAIDDSTVVFISDEKGIKNLYKYAKGDSTFQKINQISNSISNIEDFDINTNTGATIYISNENGQPYIGYLRRIDLENEYELPSLQRTIARSDNQNKLLPKWVDSPFQTKTEDNKPEATEQKTENQLDLKPDEVDTDNYIFDTSNVISKLDNKTGKANKNASTGLIIRSNSRKDSKIKGPTDFKDKFELINFDNSFVVDPIRDFGWKNSVVFSDVLQNQIVKGGIMITPNLKNGDLFLDYGNYTKRIDFGARIDRRSFYEGQEGDIGRKLLYNKVMATVSYPFNISSRLAFSPFAITTSTKYFNSVAEKSSSNFGGWQLEYVYDNTSSFSMNNLEGTRLKAKYESVKGLTSAQESFVKFSFDLRNYKKLPLDIILATRLSYGRSTGNSPKQYILGGMDNWIGYKTDSRNNTNNPLYSNNLAVDNRTAMLFADFVTNMRGFNLNKVSGTNHALINAELRFPIFKYLGANQLNSSFLKNFQATIFTDFGTVWNNRNPFEKQNDFNTRPIENSLPFSGQVTDFKSPILASYGLGARTSILGYFVKLDTAWGIDDGETMKPITYFTLGYDF